MMGPRFFQNLVAVAFLVHLVSLQVNLHKRSLSSVTSPCEEQETLGLANLPPQPREESNSTSADLQQKSSVSFPPISSNHTKVIFYHIYLPPSGSGNNAYKIVREQLIQMGGKEKDVTVLYNTIGDHPAGIIEPFTMSMTAWCHEFKLTACHHLKHYPSGREAVTLQSVHNFCQAQTNTNKEENRNGRRVGYLHNKGSYHGGHMNDLWRHLMTQALVRDECWGNQSPKSLSRPGQKTRTTQKMDADTNPQCNICGLFFTSDWGLYFSGNVWAADCSYINRLIPPTQFETKSRASYYDALLREKLSQFKMTLYRIPSLGYVGIGRYAAEWWTGSHPTIQPCDFSASVAQWKGRQSKTPPPTEGVTTSDFIAWLKAHQGSWYQMTSKKLLTKFTPQASEFASKFPNATGRKSDNDLKHEYFLLPGRMHRWMQLYGVLPAQDSWLWKHYPQGGFWKQEVKQHGLKVLDEVIPIKQGALKDLEA